MSDILQALKRGGGWGTDLSVRFGTLGVVEIRPLPPPPIQTEFARLANALLSRADEKGGLVLVFAGTEPDEGATYVSFNVARHLAAMLDRRVAWVDGDFDKPEPLLREHGLGLREMLIDPLAIETVASDAGNLVLVPNGSANIKTADLLKSPVYDQVLAEFRRNFFVTIIDAPAILGGVHAVNLAEPTDGVVVVVQSGRLKHEVVGHGLKLLADQGVKVVGTVLNRRTFAIPDAVYKKL